MTTHHRRRKKYRWLRKIKRQILTFISPKPTIVEEKPVKKRRRRSKKRSPFGAKIWQSWQSFLLFFKKKKRRRRSTRKSFKTKIYLSWLQFAQNIAQLNQKLLAPKKHRRRRKRKQYALYVMGNQKKVN
jgi:hypothetical protein